MCEGQRCQGRVIRPLPPPYNVQNGGLSVSSKVWSVVLCLVVLDAVIALPPALMLLLGVAKLDLQAEGVVVVPSLQGGAFSLASVLILAALMLTGADLLRWVGGKSARRAKPTGTRCTYGVLVGIGLFMMLLLASRGVVTSTHILLWGFTGSVNALNKMLYILSLVIIAPFAEESLFRGAIEEILGTTFNPIAAVFLSALTFSIAHGARSMLLFYFVAGTLFSMLSYKSRPLLPAMLAHATFNGLTLVYVLIK